MSFKSQVVRIQAYLLDRQRRRFISSRERKRFVQLLSNLKDEPIGLGLKGMYKMNHAFLFQVSAYFKLLKFTIYKIFCFFRFSTWQ